MANLLVDNGVPWGEGGAMMDITGNLFFRKLGKPDYVNEDGKHCYMVVGVMQMNEQLPTDTVYPIWGASHSPLAINVLIDRGLCIKEHCVGLNAEQILTKF